MLIQFNFKNYRSFKEEASLDLTAMNLPDYPERVTIIGDNRILPIAAIYGANASGKSNVYNAFEYMSRFVITSYTFGNNEKENKMLYPTPFLFSSETEKAESCFEVFFTIPGDEKEITYNYGFCVNKEGVTEEWLNSKSRTGKDFKKLIYRNDDKLDLPGINKVSRENITTALGKEVLVVSIGAILRVEICKKIRDWFIMNECTNFGDDVTNIYLYSQLPSNFVRSERVRLDVVDYFSSFDNSIKNFKVEEIPSESNSDEDNKKYYKISTYHKKTDSNQLAELSLHEESAGTLKMFALYPELKEVMENGSVFFVDELNARLHPLLVRNIILSFLDPEINQKHAQLVFTTHDTWLLNNNFLRKDEIWFTEKDNDGISTLYSLSDFDEDDRSILDEKRNYERNYLLGKYGAIPVVNSIELSN